MKIKELLKALRKFPSDMEITIEIHTEEGSHSASVERATKTQTAMSKCNHCDQVIPVKTWIVLSGEG
jgi:hypothetical protein